MSVVVAHASGRKLVTDALDVSCTRGVVVNETTSLTRVGGLPSWVASLEMRQEDLMQ